MTPTTLSRLRLGAAGRAVLAILFGIALLTAFNQSRASAAQPAVVSITPSAGVAGTTVTIFGSSLTGVTGVMFGGVPALQFNGTSDSRVLAVAPANVLGQVDVVVSTASGVSTVNNGSKFTYTVGPVVNSISPNSGRPGTIVTINGSGFTGVTSANFGGTVVAANVVSDAQVTAVAPLFSPGVVVDVTVTSPAGTSLVTFPAKFSYLPGPFVIVLAPTSGPPGTVVTIDGVGFSGATSVLFGGSAVLVTVLSDTRVRATAPAGALSITVDVQVVTNQGASPLSANAKFTYSGGPVITGISPPSGSGGTFVTISGSGFTNATSVTIGTAAAIPSVINDSTITVFAPANVLGTVNVRVTGPLGTSPVTVAGQFTYTGGPVVHGLSPSQGKAGVLVTITGSGFVGTTSVTFGGINVPFTVVTNGQILVNAPSLSPGQVNVRVTTPAGISAATTASIFTYITAPVIYSISPTHGTTGTTVTITGAGLTGATSVSFGGTLATPTVVGDTRIIVTAPARGPGTVNVAVNGTGGASAVTGAELFTYDGAGGGGPTVTYTLNFRWSLLVWLGADGANIDAALKGQLASSSVAAASVNGPEIQALTNVYSYVTALFRWHAVAQKWEASFPGRSSIPGANDFNTFTFGRAYWIAISSGPVDWTVPAN